MTATDLEREAAAGPSGLRVRWLRRLGTVLSIATFAEAIAIVLIGTRGDHRFQIGMSLITLGLLGAIVLFPLVGALIIQRRADVEGIAALAVRAVRRSEGR